MDSPLAYPSAEPPLWVDYLAAADRSSSLHHTGVRGFSPFREISSHYGIGEISDSTEGGSTKDSPNLIVGQARSAFEDKPNKSQTLQYSTPAFCGWLYSLILGHKGPAGPFNVTGLAPSRSHTFFAAETQP